MQKKPATRTYGAHVLLEFTLAVDEQQNRFDKRFLLGTIDGVLDSQHIQVQIEQKIATGHI